MTLEGIKNDHFVIAEATAWWAEEAMKLTVNVVGPYKLLTSIVNIMIHFSVSILTPIISNLHLKAKLGLGVKGKMAILVLDNLGKHRIEWFVRYDIDCALF